MARSRSGEKRAASTGAEEVEEFSSLDFAGELAGNEKEGEVDEAKQEVEEGEQEDVVVLSESSAAAEPAFEAPLSSKTSTPRLIDVVVAVPLLFVPPALVFVAPALLPLPMTFPPPLLLLLALVAGCCRV